MYEQLESDITFGSRRSFLRGSLALGAGSVGLVLFSERMAAAGKRDEQPAQGLNACSPAPVPIPGGFNARSALGSRYPDQLFHLFLPAPGAEPSTIFNFQGTVAILNIHGTGTRTELDLFSGVPLNKTPNLPFATDVRFMHGTYVGVDGQPHRGTFAFF